MRRAKVCVILFIILSLVITISWHKVIKFRIVTDLEESQTDVHIPAEEKNLSTKALSIRPPKSHVAVSQTQARSSARIKKPLNSNVTKTNTKSSLRCTNKDVTAPYTNTDIRSLVGKSLHMARNRTGYVLALTFREQQTRASANIFSLQCWAKTLSVYVVEPFVMDSRLFIPMNPTQHSELLRFRDLIDVSLWQRVSMRHGFAPLAGWDVFLADAPRKLIVVRYKYTQRSTIAHHKQERKKMSHLAVNNEYKHGCDDSEELTNKLKYLTSVHNFIVVRDVCFNFDNGDELTLFQFNRHLYGEFTPKQVTVVMEEWRGIPANSSTGKRVVVYDACWTQFPIYSTTYTWPSPRILCDAQRYKRKYLKSNAYIGLMVRTEKIMLNSGSEDTLTHVSYCLSKTLAAWKKLKKKTGIKLTFLSMDVGKYGSTSLNSAKYLRYLNMYESFIREVYGPSASISTWESEFETITSVRDTGYIGALQKTLVAYSNCILLSGGGSFQKHGKYMYERIHKDKKQCIQVINDCFK